MGLGQIIAGHAHEQMMFAVIIDPIRRQRHPHQHIGFGGACVAERVITTGGGAGMFGNVADPQDQLEGGRQRRQPDQERPDAERGQADQQHDQLDQQEAPDGSRRPFSTLKIDHRSRDSGCAVAVERSTGRVIAFGRGSSVLGTGQHRLQTFPRDRELVAALLEKGLAGQVADDLAPHAGLAGREGSGQAEIGIFALLGETVMGQMIGAVAVQIAAGRRAGQPLAGKIIGLAPGVEQAVRRFVHQDRQPQLPPADQHQRDRGRDQPGEPVPLPEQSGAAGDQRHHQPAVQRQPQSVPARHASQRRPFLAGEYLIRFGSFDSGHDAILFLPPI